MKDHLLNLLLHRHRAILVTFDLPVKLRLNDVQSLLDLNLDVLLTLDKGVMDE